MHPKIETITAPIDNTPARQNSVSHGKEILRRLVKEKGLDDAPDMTDEMMDDVVNWVEKYTTQIFIHPFQNYNVSLLETRRHFLPEHDEHQHKVNNNRYQQ